MKSMMRTWIERSTRLARVPIFATIGFFPSPSIPPFAQESLPSDQWTAILGAEDEKISTISRIYPKVVALDDAERDGGGSGVFIRADGIAPTNHQVIMGIGFAIPIEPSFDWLKRLKDRQDLETIISARRQGTDVVTYRFRRSRNRPPPSGRDWYQINGSPN